MIRACVATLAVLVFVTSAALSVRAGLADFWGRQGSIKGAERAAALAPDDATWQILLAVLTADSDSGRTDRALMQAAALNPRDAQIWINLGLRAEIEGKLPDSERFLLRAAEVDKTYLPQWTLANYYARRGNAGSFWRWAGLAAKKIPGDPVPLFRLCGGIAEDGKLIERLALEDPSLQASFLHYLLDNGHLAVIQNAIERVISNGRAVDTPLLLNVCERLIGQGRGNDALGIWNRLTAAKFITAQPLDPIAGATLTNGDFAQEPLALGFDWRLPRVDGVSASRLEEHRIARALRLIFTGKQPESCEPLLQWLPAAPGMEYALTWRSSTHGISSGSGLRWVVTAATGAILAQSGELWSESAAPGHLAFATPRGCHLVRLALSYQRMPGTPRIAGSVALGELRVSVLGAKR